MPVQLRDYQTAAIAAGQRAYAQGRRRVVVTLPTGAGKTITMMSLVARAVAKGSRVIWLAHRDELVIGQPSQAALALGVREEQIGVVKAARDEVAAPLVLASIQTLAREARRLRCLPGEPPFRLCIYDEGHHAASTSARAVLAALPADCMVIGLTATPERGDGASLASVYPGGICYSYSLLEAIRDGWLCDFRAVQVDIPELTLDALAVGADGDYEDGALADAMAEDAVIRATSRACVDHCAGRRALIFCASVLQSEKTAAEMRSAGLAAQSVDGSTPLADRRAAIEALRRGELDALCNCQLFTEGTDIPEADAIIMARPTLSKGFYLQQIGRGLRQAAGKDGCVIVDLVGASILHQPYTAPVLVGAARGMSGWLGAGALAGGGETAKRQWDVRENKRQWAAWVNIGQDGIIAASGAERSMVIVRPTSDGGWLADFWRGDLREPLTPAPVWRELAVGLAEDVIRRIEGAKKLSKAGADWRAGPPSDRQIAALARCRIDAKPATKGEAADLMTRFFAGRLLARTPR